MYWSLDLCSVQWFIDMFDQQIRILFTYMQEEFGSSIGTELLPLIIRDLDGIPIKEMYLIGIVAVVVGWE